MTLKTKLFGKKVQGLKLINLVEALGINPDFGADSSSPEFFIKTHGRYALSLSAGGIEVDLYVFRQKYSPEKNREIVTHLTGKIPYNRGLI